MSISSSNPTNGDKLYFHQHPVPLEPPLSINLTGAGAGSINGEDSSQTSQKKLNNVKHLFTEEEIENLKKILLEVEIAQKNEYEGADSIQDLLSLADSSVSHGLSGIKLLMSAVKFLPLGPLASHGLEGIGLAMQAPAAIGNTRDVGFLVVKHYLISKAQIALTKLSAEEKQTEEFIELKKEINKEHLNLVKETVIQGFDTSVLTYEITDNVLKLAHINVAAMQYIGWATSIISIGLAAYSTYKLGRKLEKHISHLDKIQKEIHEITPDTTRAKEVFKVLREKRKKANEEKIKKLNILEEINTLENKNLEEIVTKLKSYKIDINSIVNFDESNKAFIGKHLFNILNFEKAIKLININREKTTNTITEILNSNLEDRSVISTYNDKIALIVKDIVFSQPTLSSPLNQLKEKVKLLTSEDNPVGYINEINDLLKNLEIAPGRVSLENLLEKIEFLTKYKQENYYKKIKVLKELEPIKTSITPENFLAMVSYEEIIEILDNNAISQLIKRINPEIDITNKIRKVKIAKKEELEKILKTPSLHPAAYKEITKEIENTEKIIERLSNHDFSYAFELADLKAILKEQILLQTEEERKELILQSINTPELKEKLIQHKETIDISLKNLLQSFLIKKNKSESIFFKYKLAHSSITVGVLILTTIVSIILTILAASGAVAVPPLAILLIGFGVTTLFTSLTAIGLIIKIYKQPKLFAAYLPKYNPNAPWYGKFASDNVKLTVNRLYYAYYQLKYFTTSISVDKAAAKIRKSGLAKDKENLRNRRKELEEVKKMLDDVQKAYNESKKTFAKHGWLDIQREVRLSEEKILTYEEAVKLIAEFLTVENPEIMYPELTAFLKTQGVDLQAFSKTEKDSVAKNLIAAEGVIEALATKPH